MKQVFIFSLPRSGSTLLQRTLMAHQSIASISEPWILLPQIYSLKEQGTISEYGSMLASIGINNLINNLPRNIEDYYESLGKFIDEIHVKLSKNKEEYFLDKTPRYYLIINELRQIFPEAKFIFLFRSPEQIYSSMIQTWANNRLKPFLDSYHDLLNGNKKLSKAYSQFKNQSIAIRYEDFVGNTETQLKFILDYLDLPYDPLMIQNFQNQETKGGLGDPTGIVDYNTISNKSLIKWKQSITSPFRKKIIYNLIKKIDTNDLKIQGYDKKNILNSILDIKTRIKFSDLRDLSDYCCDYLIRKFNLHLFFSKTFKWIRTKFMS